MAIPDEHDARDHDSDGHHDHDSDGHHDHDGDGHHDHDGDGHHDHDHDTASSVTDRVHHNSWSANLELPEHAEDPEVVVAGAVEAIEHTAPGNHVNLVTHGEHGHPEAYLYPELDARYDHDWEYVEQCGCGGHVTRVYVA